MFHTNLEMGADAQIDRCNEKYLKTVITQKLLIRNMTRKYCKVRPGKGCKVRPKYVAKFGRNMLQSLAKKCCKVRPKNVAKFGRKNVVKFGREIC